MVKWIASLPFDTAQTVAQSAFEDTTAGLTKPDHDILNVRGDPGYLVLAGFGTPRP